MGGEQTGHGRVTVFPLTHHWPDRRCLLAYTTTGDFGTTAIVGALPVPELEHPDLLAVAADHHPQGLYGSRGGHEVACAGWVICTGWSARIGGSGPRLDIPTPDGACACTAASNWPIRCTATTYCTRAPSPSATTN
ncbi:hypothetical protein [Streptomyces phytophilus]|uniref:hypothetical protein n=1 Tax=Streptomyces phytophilus TaxID=722715 RepID=UPI00215D7B9C|nr:hypothetical protein [Streptomyces phytophilus]